VSRDPDVNVVGDELLPCSAEPLTGFFRAGCCSTGEEDVGSHTVRSHRQRSRAGGTGGQHASPLHKRRIGCSRQHELLRLRGDERLATPLGKAKPITVSSGENAK
jgi:hypothetical protein